MPSWGGGSRRARRQLRRLDETIEELRQALAEAEEVVDAAQLDTHFRLNALEGAAA